MTTKIAVVANLAFHVFQQHSILSSIKSSASSVSMNCNGVTNSLHLSTENSNYGSKNNLSSGQYKHFPEQLQRLLLSLHSLTPKDVGFDLKWISDSGVSNAPVAYIHIMENEIFSMGIFVLRPGSRIPLHDHPNMYGVLRVLYGSIRCRSFTRLKNIKSSNLNQFSSMFSGSKWQLKDLIMARPHQDKLLNANSDPMMLFPVDGNFHEISPVDGAAVFLDILSPPYDHDMGTRECRFYKEITLPQMVSTEIIKSSLSSSDIISPNESDSDQDLSSTSVSGSSTDPIVYLVETNQPLDYWCESAEYAGPSLV